MQKIRKNERQNFEKSEKNLNFGIIWAKVCRIWFFFKNWASSVCCNYHFIPSCQKSSERANNNKANQILATGQKQQKNRNHFPANLSVKQWMSPTLVPRYGDKKSKAKIKLWAKVQWPADLLLVENYSLKGHQNKLRDFDR